MHLHMGTRDHQWVVQQTIQLMRCPNFRLLQVRSSIWLATCGIEGQSQYRRGICLIVEERDLKVQAGKVIGIDEIVNVSVYWWDPVFAT